MIKTRIIEKESRIIDIRCPYCNRVISRRIETGRRKGKDTCEYCLTVFEWEEVDEVIPMLDALYTLTCEKCGDSFESKMAFPSPQLCIKCFGGKFRNCEPSRVHLKNILGTKEE